jgi:DNA-binding MarR family transcriptional regulator
VVASLGYVILNHSLLEKYAVAKPVHRTRVENSRSSLGRQGARQYPISINTYVPTLVNRVAGAALKGASGEFAKRGLTVPKYRILLTVAEYENLHFRDLARLTSVERPTLSRLLDEMQSADLLRRRRDPNDSRSVNISLKAPGRALLESTTEWALDVEKDILKGITDVEAQLLRRLLVRMFENLAERSGRLKKSAPTLRRRRRGVDATPKADITGCGD